MAPTDFRFNLYQTQTHNQNANCFESIRGHSCFVSAPEKGIVWTATIFVQVWTLDGAALEPLGEGAVAKRALLKPEVKEKSQALGLVPPENTMWRS